MNRLNGLIDQIIIWQNDTFPSATAKSKLLHLREEIEELLMEINNPNMCIEDLESEFADCFLLLFGAANKIGFTLKDIQRIMSEKLNKNKMRNWQEPDENNVYRHIKE